MAKLSKDTKCLFRGILTTTETASSHEETQGFTGPPLTRPACVTGDHWRKKNLQFLFMKIVRAFVVCACSHRAAYLHPDASQMAMKHFVVEHMTVREVWWQVKKNFALQGSIENQMEVEQPGPSTCDPPASWPPSNLELESLRTIFSIFYRPPVGGVDSFRKIDSHWCCPKNPI